jgi:large subunit ribosomal protein L25
MEHTIECQKREDGSKPRALRRSGLIPAVLYGHKGAESLSLTINAKTAENLLKAGAVNNTLIQLNVPDLSWSGKTLLREVQLHPWKNYPYHLSFFAVGSQESIEVEVPLHFVGEAAGVKIEGGVLDPVITELKVQCAPDKIPEAIEIDISGLQIGDILLINQIILPEGVTVLNEPEQPVVIVVASAVSAESVQEEEEEAAAAESA